MTPPSSTAITTILNSSYAALANAWKFTLRSRREGRGGGVDKQVSQFSKASANIYGSVTNPLQALESMIR